MCATADNTVNNNSNNNNNNTSMTSSHNVHAQARHAMPAAAQPQRVRAYVGHCCYQIKPKAITTTTTTAAATTTTAACSTNNAHISVKSIVTCYATALRNFFQITTNARAQLQAQQQEEEERPQLAASKYMPSVSPMRPLGNPLCHSTALLIFIVCILLRMRQFSFYLLLLLLLILQMHWPAALAAPQSCIYCREEDLKMQQQISQQHIKETSKNYEEFLFEHQVTRKDAILALKTLNETFYLGPAPESSCKSVVCTKKVMNYCLGPQFINDHCWCELGHTDEGLPFVPHICYVGEKTYKASVGSCFFYEEVKECCCAPALATQWRHISGTTTALRAPKCLLIYLLLLIYLTGHMQAYAKNVLYT